MAVRIFAGIAVNDFRQPLDWYQRFLCAEPAFYPNDIEAVWELAEDHYVYIIRDVDRAGGAVTMIWVDDPVAEVARIAGQGIESEDVEKNGRGLEVRVPRRRLQRDGNRWTSRLTVGRTA